MAFKHFKYLGIAVLTFSAGVGMSALRPKAFHHDSQNVLTFKLQPMAVKSTAEVKRTYQSVMHASGRAGRYEACFGIFSSSDGMDFSTTNIYFDSPEQAQRELEKRLKLALEILSREKSVDETGQVVGELVVATFPPSDKALTPSAQLLQTKGADFVSISSSSLHNLTEYKKDRKP
jgi:hypothetical protein